MPNISGGQIKSLTIGGDISFTLEPVEPRVKDNTFLIRQNHPNFRVLMALVIACAINRTKIRLATDVDFTTATAGTIAFVVAQPLD